MSRNIDDSQKYSFIVTHENIHIVFYLIYFLEVIYTRKLYI